MFCSEVKDAPHLLHYSHKCHATNLHQNFCAHLLDTRKKKKKSNRKRRFSGKLVINLM